MKPTFTSQVSIEECASDQDISTNPVTHQFISNLKAKCQFRGNAIQTAESLIAAYKKENQEFKQENDYLRAKLQKHDTLQQRCLSSEVEVKELQRALLKYSRQIQELLQQKMKDDTKIHEMQMKIVTQKKEYQENIQRLRTQRARQELNQKQKQVVEHSFKNYLKFPSEQQSLRSSVGSSKNNEERKSMEWTLRQKDEEIIILLKRLKVLEERSIKGNKINQNFKTVQSSEQFSNKRLKVSQFQ